MGWGRGGGGPSYVILTKWWVYTRLYGSIFMNHIIKISCGTPKVQIFSLL